jgi:hypothetical protein
LCGNIYKKIIDTKTNNQIRDLPHLFCLEAQEELANCAKETFLANNVNGSVIEGFFGMSLTLMFHLLYPTLRDLLVPDRMV